MKIFIPTIDRDSASFHIAIPATPQPRRPRPAALWLLAAVLVPGCLQDEPLDGEPDDGEATAEATAELNAGVFDVGVIPDRDLGCPSGSEEIIIRMDDEDGNNGSWRSGFVGKTNLFETGSATRLYVCKVDGTRFSPFGTVANDLRDDYAVLKLASSCPAGSQEFSRYFDNEDSNNGNFAQGGLWPNVVNSNTRLYFCLFRYATAGVGTMAAFPNLEDGFRYGVFGPSDFNRGAIAFGTIRTDDEDSGNGNSYTASSDVLLAAQRIIQPDRAVSNGATFLRVIRAQ